MSSPLASDRLLPDEVRGMAKFLYTQNPFYLISACLVLYGLLVSFGQNTSDVFDPWRLASVLCGYTLVMAATAVVLVRFGKIWDDARSILLILLFLFLAISVSFDQVCRTDRGTAMQVLLFGLTFCVLVSEGLFRYLPLRFDPLLRLPYYLFLGLFFLYPLWVSQPDVEKTVLAWRIFLFPVCAALIALLLLPAIRRGRDSSTETGTPWKWPLYPWTVFVFLAVGVCFRAFVLSLSFDPKPDRELFSAFGLYFLTPFLMAVSVVLLEIGIREKNRIVQLAALGGGPLLLLTAITDVGTGSAEYTAFLNRFIGTLGSPLWLTTAAVIGFYLIAWLRRVRRAELFLFAMLAFASFVGPRTVSWSTAGEFQFWPLGVLGVIQIVTAIKTGHSLAWLAAISCLAGMVVGLLWDTSWGYYGGTIAFHIVMVAAFAISLLRPDRYAPVLRLIAAMMVGVAAISTAAFAAGADVPSVVRIGYLGTLTAASYVAFRSWRESWWLVAAAVDLVSLLSAASVPAIDMLHQTVGPRGFYPVAAGIVFFILAALISAQKCGLLPRVWNKLFENTATPAAEMAEFVVEKRPGVLD